MSTTTARTALAADLRACKAYAFCDGNELADMWERGELAGVTDELWADAETNSDCGSMIKAGVVGELAQRASRLAGWSGEES